MSTIITNPRHIAIYCAAYDSTISQYGYRGLEDCYKGWSTAKTAAIRKITTEMLRRSGYGLTVTSFNSMTFTVMYLFPDAENGEIMLCVETRDNSRIMPYNGRY